ncbi:MAG: M1 family metallopeptidase [Actinobacteria bacterium]|nr:M1 family metallopeptidase [Actinomycetota bacterium]MBU1943252.1 M1 family metallopeptidase [Actinomycetota bacterium]MBU2688999.1 M1 family metallopeptidase [Actinomycetota bacterium]
MYRLVAEALLVSVLFSAASGVCLLAAGCGQPQASLPTTASQMKAARAEAEEYLTTDGERLARGKTYGATIYSVYAELDAKAKSVQAEERVLYTNRTKAVLSEVVFRVYANDPGTGLSGRGVEFDEVKADGRPAEHTLEGSFLEVGIPGGLPPGEEAFVAFSFNEKVPPVDESGNGGIYGYGEGVFDLGNFLPTVVTCPDGTWDRRETPTDGDVAFYDCSYYFVSFDAPDGFTVAATGVETGRRGDAHVYAAGPSRDFEAQAGSGYLSADREVGSTTVTSYFSGEDRKAGLEALDSGCAALEQFSEHFGPYPYTRLNICEAPLSDSYGMEFTGQVQIASFLYEDLEETTVLDLTVAHEVCHQWWALGVGSDSIGHPWQDESLTSYCEVAYSLWEHGEEKALGVLEDLADGYVAAREDGVPDAAVDQPVAGFRDGDQYGAIVYSKGPFFFDELWNEMGELTFEEALQDYYEKNVFRNATGEELSGALRARSEDPAAFDALYDRWIKETHGDEDIRYEAI